MGLSLVVEGDRSTDRNMKEYIFIAYNPSILGGGELYVSDKVRYLEANGWKVHTFFPGDPEDRSLYPHMQPHMKDAIPAPMLSLPPYRRMKWEQEYIINYMCERLSSVRGDVDEIIIESVEDVVAYWAELLAAQIGARHIFVACNEYFRHPRQSYEDNLDFFYFKWKRRELFAPSEVIRRIFNGYKNVVAPLGRIPKHICPEPNPVLPVKNDAINKIEKMDLNICHIGRANKLYVKNMLDGFARFAQDNPDKKVQYIFVGDMNYRAEYIREIFADIENVKLVFLGDLFPIPKELFSKVDAVCAISQSAFFSSQQGLPIIVASNYGNGCAGILGEDCESTIPDAKAELFPYEIVLNRICSEDFRHDDKNNLDLQKFNDLCYEEFLDVSREASSVKEYYDIFLTKEKPKGYIFLFPYDLVPKGSRVVLYGSGQVGKDYRRQLAIQDFCNLVGVVDRNYDDYDDDVQDPKMLSVWEYDYILISVAEPSVAESIKMDILAIAPYCMNKIIFSPSTIRVI